MISKFKALLNEFKLYCHAMSERRQITRMQYQVVLDQTF